MGRSKVTDPNDDPRRADDAVMEALLERIHDHDAASRARRIDRALASTIAEQDSRPIREQAMRSSRFPRWLQAAAAALLFLVIFLWPGDGAPSAIALVSRSVKAMRMPVDRHYDLRIALAGEEEERIRGELHQNGDGRLALRIDTPAGDLWAGEGRESSWVVPPPRLLPVLLRPSGSTFGMTLPGSDGTRLPMLDLAGMLERLSENHELEATRTENGMTIIRATLGEEPTRLQAPDHVELTARVDGTVQQLLLQWSNPRPMQARSFRLTFLGSPRHRDDFYEHTSHHEGRRIIDRR